MRPGWRDHAACAAPEVAAQVRDGELFLLPKDLASAPRLVRQIVARSAAICATCPALEQCRQWALDGEVDPCPSHVLAGMSPTERQRLRRQMGVRAPLPPVNQHGTPAGFHQHRRRGEAPCVDCTVAQRQHEQVYRAKRRGTTAARMAVAQANRRRRGRAA